MDTGCLVKLYYPEPESQKVSALVAGKVICFSPLHELEFTNALHLKLFHRSATLAQVHAARTLVEADTSSGVLLHVEVDWTNIFARAVELSKLHSGDFGCRSLDVLHCATAKFLLAAEFLATDARQKQMASAMGLNLVSF